MKALKKLVPTICMLLVSAVLLGSSTYAWFSMNTQVTATGMSVKATTSKNLVISNAAGGTFAASAESIYTTTVTMKPASTADGKAWFTMENGTGVDLDGAANTGAAFVTASPTALTSADANPGTIAVAQYSYYVKTDGASDATFDKLYVKSINVTGDDGDALSKALRIAVVCGENAFIYNPLGGTATYKGVVATGTVGTDTVFSTNDVTLSAVNTPNNSLGAVSTTATEVKVYVWYEGQDANCKTANTLTIKTLSISIGFEAADNATA